MPARHCEGAGGESGQTAVGADVFQGVIGGKAMGKIGRNALCPCGSGRKYKHCCGNEMARPRETPRASSTLLPRHEIWRRQYRANRYARHLSDQEMNQRIRDVFLGMLRLTPEAKIGLPPLGGEGVRMMEEWTHVLEEMALRNRPYPTGFTRDILHSEPIPDFASELGSKAASRLGMLGLERDTVFVKFGKRQYMEKLYEEGGLRIQPASYFLEKDHNGAVRDDELSIPLSLVLSRDMVVNLVKNPWDVPDIMPDQRVDVKINAPSDYWLYCVSNSAESRLFVDFSADACVVIRDKHQFSERLKYASIARLPHSSMRHGSAEYIDPLLPKTSIIDVPFAKHFRYAYQYEYRFCWFPTAPNQRLTHIDVELGNLKDIAELIVL